MGVVLDIKSFNEYLSELSEEFRIFAPALKKGKGKFSETDIVAYSEIKCLEDMELKQKSYFSPKEILYPIREILFYFKGDSAEVPSIDEKPALIFARPCDLNGISRLDTIFLKNGSSPDFYYKRRKDLVKFVMIECTDSFETCFCVSMKSNIYNEYEAAINFKDNHLYMKIVDPALETPTIKASRVIDYEPEFINSNDVHVSIPAVEKVTNEVFNHEIWKEYTSRCIGCGCCNTSCITCSCFTMQDVKLSDNNEISERRRVWAGCHIDGFSDMAGGHTFREKNGERMRFKTMHKINDYYKRFSEHMCVGCGRCDDVCPEYISFSKCINKLNTIIEEDTVCE
ncbi:anaerobic sulfite reductase subunit AsrA [Pseudobacteroides cellulosolvens]|uniref:Sulfite reductase, subunit A n=1 Tax=Pseudobacteroides cellulosolvens ATCC 35603 = DSM 2933 TaxID=398512 RepID=A0A0L6JTE2_9FIRM|nr:anaerobic sulfite reductase subunit AsrA [Pseudobacteroides cellulosolvens]KNY28979.1 sulfite reductase, subunit A [Pseudobacteroides cellulosolvens ATCC 35603 = DSM 2933]